MRCVNVQLFYFVRADVGFHSIWLRIAIISNYKTFDELMAAVYTNVACRNVMVTVWTTHSMVSSHQEHCCRKISSSWIARVYWINCNCCHLFTHPRKLPRNFEAAKVAQMVSQSIIFIQNLLTENLSVFHLHFEHKDIMYIIFVE